MKKEIIATQKAPGAIGPYSQGISLGEMIITSGQLPIDMVTGELETGCIKKATTNSLNNIKAILEEAGTSMDKIVKTTIFMTDLAEFGSMNEAYGEFFKENPPARSCVQVAALPKGATIEIEAIAVK